MRASESSDSPVDQLSLDHLQAELARIDLLIRREVQRWQLAGQDPNDAFRGLYVSDAQANALLDRPLATSWGQAVPTEPVEAEAFATTAREVERRIHAFLEAARTSGQVLRLQRLASVFDLDAFAVDTLLLCLAPALDLRYERLYGYLQDDVTRKRPCVNLILDLLCPPGIGRLSALSHFTDEAPLFRHGILERVAEAGPGRPNLLAQSLQVDETIVAWLLGHKRLHEEIAAYARLTQSEPTETDRVMASEAWRALAQADGNTIAICYGSDSCSQHAAARLWAASRQCPLLTVDLAALASDMIPARAVRLALRDARLYGALPCLAGWDVCLQNGLIAPTLLTEICAYPGPMMIIGQAPWYPSGIERKRPFLRLDFCVPRHEQRREIWRHFLRGDIEVKHIDMDVLAGQFLLTAGQIRDVVASARDTAAQRQAPLSNQDLFAAARAHSNQGLASLARKIVPRYTWEDIVLPADQVAILREIIVTVRGRPVVLEQWGVGRKLASSPGVTILFAGPPGTGKTMAAEIIAAELGLDLYKIDLSTIVSKYVGETEKNLERIFAEASTSNAILFFDEADALFGKRSEVRDAHDRYANIEISYLLQRMEAYEGVTILATNLRANLDEAFTRRLQFAVDFPFPEEADRLRIWQTLFPPGVPRAEDLDLPFLARRYRLAGGSIRNIIVSAAYLATADGQAVTMEHLLHSARRELQKMGRLVAEEDLGTKRQE